MVFMKEKINNKILIGIKLLLIKYLYILSIAFMLPNKWLGWSYDKYICVEYAPVELVVFVMCLSAYLWGYKDRNPYTTLSTLLFIIFFIPANSGLVLSDNCIEYYVLINIYSLILFLLLSNTSKKDYKCQVNCEAYIQNLNGNYAQTGIKTLTYVICIIVSIYVYCYNGFCFGFDMPMYLARAKFVEYIKSISGSVWSYLLLLLTELIRWILPIVLYCAVSKRKYIDTTVCLLTYFLLFSVSREKSTLMIAFAAIFLSICEKHVLSYRMRIPEFLVNMFLLLFMLVFVEDIVCSSTYLFNIFIERLLYMPTYMIKTHYNFFSIHNKLWFTQDVFLWKRVVKTFSHPVYTISRTELISEYIYSGLIPSPNAGLFSEAYAQLGIIGILVFPFIVVTIAKIICRNIVWYGSGVTTLLMIIFCMELLSISILEAITLVGVCFFCVVTYLLRQQCLLLKHLHKSLTQKGNCV